MLRYKLILLSVVLSMCVSDIAQAATSNRFSIAPINSDNRMVYSVKPGEVKVSQLMITNLEKVPETLLLYSVDAGSTRDGVFAPGARENKSIDVGTWVQLPFEKVTVPPMERIIVSVTTTIPLNASPGDHFGAVVIEPTTPDTVVKQGQGTVNSGTSIVTRVAVRMYITVAGERIEKFTMSDLSTDWLKDDLFIRFTLKNEGNVRLTPEMNFKVLASDSGKDLGVINNVKKINDFFPGKTINTEFKWEKSKNNGPVDITVDLKIGDKIETRKIHVDTGTLSIPKQVVREYGSVGLVALIICVSFLLIIILLFLLMVWRKLEKMQNASNRRKRGPRRED